MDVIEELTEFEDRIDRAHVERRVRDWETRIDDLYARVAAWLPEGWTASLKGTVGLHEPLMQRFDLREHRLPQLSLERAGERVGIFEPRGLWIMGSNGRVDLIGSIGHHIINDRSEFFEEPDWRIAAFSDRFDESPLTPASVRRILR